MMAVRIGHFFVRAYVPASMFTNGIFLFVGNIRWTYVEEITISSVE